MSSKAYATRATCWQGTQICIWKSTAAALLFPQAIFLPLLPPCSWLPLLLFVLQANGLCPVILRWFFLTHLSAIETVPTVALYVNWFQLYSIQYRLILSTGLGSPGEF